MTKSQILAAVREAKGEASAQLIDHLKKDDMAQEAERLLAGTGWLPALLRTPGLASSSQAVPAGETEAIGDEVAVTLPAFLTGEGEEDGAPADDPAALPIAAE